MIGWHPDPAYFRILHGAGYFFTPAEGVGHGVLHRRGMSRGKATGVAGKMTAPAMWHQLLAADLAAPKG